jgi:hypothetical protein
MLSLGDLTKLDVQLAGKAVSSLLKFEKSKSTEKNGKKQLMSGYSKPIILQVSMHFNS